VLQEGKVAGTIPDVTGFFQLTYSIQSHYGPVIDSACNKNKYQECSLGVKGVRPVCKADVLTAICEPIIQKMRQPLRLITLQASTAF
jgi:hypothetical protein